MSLEQALNANTAAIEKLIAVFQGAATTMAVNTGVGPDVTDKPKKLTAEEKKAVVKKAVESTVPAIQATEEKPAVPPYETVKAAVLNVKAVKGMEAAKALLAQFGVKTLPEVKPEKLADVLTAAEKELA